MTEQLRPPEIGKTYKSHSAETHSVVEHYEENHDIVPGQNGPVGVVIETTFNKDGLISEIKVTRENSLVPSTLTRYTYDSEEAGKKLVAVDNFLVKEDGLRFLVQEIVEKGKPAPAPLVVGGLLKSFDPPIPGVEKDFSSTIQDAETLKHPAVVIKKDGDEDIALTMNFHTDIEGTRLEVSVIRFTNGDKKLMKSLARRTLIRIEDKVVEPTSTNREFVFNDQGEIVGRKFYSGDELIYTDRYYVPTTFSIGGNDFKFSDFERELGEFNKKQTGREKENWRAVALDPKTGNPRRYMPDYTGLFCIIPSEKK